MIPDGALVFFKSRPAIVRRDGDRIELTFEGGAPARVRDKDVEPIHPGPLKAVPRPAQGGEFQTAWDMTAGSSLSLGELADLAFGSAGPSETLACRLAAAEGILFRMDGERVAALSAEEREAEEAKRRRKEGEAAERAAFVERAKRGKTEPGDERFWGEVEALALGRTQKSRMASDIGAGEGPESAQAWLLKAGLWTTRTNPHPARSGHPSKAPDLELGPDDDEGRVDLTGMEAWAIDNAWSHDPDDAVSWDGEAVWVHVADPASAITPGSPADLEASNRSGTLYLPEGAIPMLPDAALERFGLGLSATSRALSFRIALDPDGLVSDVRVAPSLVRVSRASYGQADPMLASGPLAELARVAELRKAYRLRNGAVDIDIPEVRVWVDSGEPRIDPVARYASSGVVREMMVMAGEGLARWAFDRGLPFPYYSQEAPGSREGLPGGLAGEFAKRRLMKAGMAGAQPRAHQGLGVTMYAQATSPLRRYGDLLGHQQARAALAAESGRSSPPPLPADELSMRLARAAAGAQAVRKAERQSELHWTIAWLLDRPGWEGDAVAVQAGGGDAQLYLPEIGLETRIRASGLEQGAAVRVRFQKADIARLDVQFSII
ncbi:MAG: RNB domain-containing ribonuclease [Spirochaetes bacterium]|nr:RNB domain-containing ribonuclease [Spirochaetota bacterium]MBU1082013.1 RNB domain-containing ribonuclease [Spirochaetota bacterium]